MPEMHVGISIVPGQWRPHFPQEHIAWVRPPWPTNDYVWLDFPETVWCEESIHFLSHRNPNFDVTYPDEPRVEWQREPDGLRHERVLPSGVRWEGRLRLAGETNVSMELQVTNESPEPFTNVRFQTCAYLRAIKEFGDFTNRNKFLHVPGRGWVTLEEALNWSGEAVGSVSVGWGWRPKVADWPVIVTVSKEAERLLAMSWYGSTCTLVGNGGHPCMHADPYMKDLAPGESDTIRGELLFFEGDIEAFATWWRARATD